MEFRTIVEVPRPSFLIEPLEEMLFVGSCFADSVGRRFVENKFRATVNPYGTMYNPASVLHTIERFEGAPRVVFITLGTNHVYRLKATGEIVDNCQKRPASLFQEEQLGTEECADYLRRAIDLLRQRRPDVQVVLTVSPIRYRKYGYHESQLSKAILLLAIDRLLATERKAPAAQREATPHPRSALHYFPAYELVLDELRDYRFYQPDMLHPSPQAVDYIWERLAEAYFSERTHQFLRDWAPIKAALEHRPFHPDSPDYQQFLADAKEREAALVRQWTDNEKANTL